MELSHSIDKAIYKVSNIPTQTHARHPVFRVGVLPSSNIGSQLPIVRRRMWLTM